VEGADLSTRVSAGAAPAVVAPAVVAPIAAPVTLSCTSMTVDAPSPAGGLFAPGAIFARRYRLVHRLRSGPVTDVWRADDLVEHTSVAVEIVVAEDDARKQDILQQIDIARGLTHPGICRVFDAGEAEGRIYCSLELVDGENLHTVFRRAGRLPPEKVADIGRQLCRALAACERPSTPGPSCSTGPARSALPIWDSGCGPTLRQV
jgi:serine/threonine-protein kinase